MINKSKIFHTVFVVCSFIPYLGVISAWYNAFWLIKQPLFMLYQIIVCILLVIWFIEILIK